MKRREVAKGIIFSFCFLFVVSLLSGCVIRTYTVAKDRVDQDVAGNRGYIQGNIPAQEAAKAGKKTRDVTMVEIELRSPIKFERGLPKAKTATKEDEELWGNLGYVSGSPTAKDIKTRRRRGKRVAEEVTLYKVKKGDTLQKISMKFFGTTKKYAKICQDNKDKLKSCERIYPGQTIKIIK